jgi:AcrR family transcriptional regulator
MTDVTKHDLKETIVASAAELFMEKGFAATSIRDIAERAECSTANLYYHFKNKQSLFREVMIYCSHDVDEMFHHIQSADNLHDFLQQLGTAAMLQMPRMLRNINWLLLEFPTMSEEDRMYFRQRQMEFHNLLRALRRMTKRTNSPGRCSAQPLAMDNCF